MFYDIKRKTETRETSTMYRYSTCLIYYVAAQI